MVQLVNPVVDLSRSIGGPQPGLAPQGEQSLFSEVLAGGSGENVLLGGGGGDVLPPFINPTVPSGRSGRGGGGFISGLASNPLFQAGIAGLSGGRPLETFQAGIQAQADARQKQFENQLKVKLFQQKQAEFQQQQQKQAQVGALLTGFADEAEAAGDPNAKGFRLAATNLNPQAAQALLASKQGKSKTLTDEELEAEGLPPDTVAQRDKDGKLNIVFNSSVDSQEARIARARAGATTVNVGKPLTELAKIEADQKAGRITQQEADRQKAKKLDFTEAQVNTAGYARRVELALTEMERLVSTGFDPSTLSDAVARKLPLGAFLRTPEAQIYWAAGEDLANAVNRRDSGAAVPDSEVESAIRRYLPLPGESEQAILAKRERLGQVVNTFKRQSRGAYEELFESPEQSPEQSPQQGQQGEFVPPAKPLEQMTPEEVKEFLRANGLEPVE